MITRGPRLALPLICGLLIWLWLAPDPWPVNPFPFPWPRNPYPWWVRWGVSLLAMLVVWAAGSEHPGLGRIRSWMEQRAMVLLLIGLSLAFVYGWASSLVPLYTFDSRGPGPSLDLALYSSICWNTWEGRPFQSIWGHYFAIHTSLVPITLLPLCMPGIGIAGYLAGHSLLLALPALPLFWLARRSLPAFPALLLAWAYLVLPGIFSHATEWELKEAPLIALPLACGFLFYRRGQFRAFLASVILGVGVVEYYAPVFGLFGLVAWRQRRSAAWVIAPLLVAALWTGVAHWIVLPFFRQAYPNAITDAFQSGLIHYRHLGDSPSAILQRVVRDPLSTMALFTDRLHVAFLYELLAPFLFVLPWAAPEALFALWELAIDLPTSTYDVLLLNGGHAGLASTALLAGTIGSLGWLARRRDSYAPALVRSLASSVLVLAATSPVTVGSAIYPLHQLRQPRQALAEAVALVPAELPVAAPPGVVPHLVNRSHAYYLWENPDLDQLAAILFDHRGDRAVDEWESDLLRAVRGDPAYQLAYERDGVLLFLRRSP